MKTLIMDTSNTYLVVALYDGDTCLESIQEKGNKRQSEYAILYVKKILEKHRLQMLDIDEMVITIGPGSYTGVRVALTIAKTIAAVTDIKIKCISSLKAYAGMQKAISVIDARSQKVYVGVYNQGEKVIEEQLLLITDFAAFYQQYPEYTLVGDASLVGGKDSEIDLASNLFNLAKLETYVENIDALVPHYIKEVEAKQICL